MNWRLRLALWLYPKWFEELDKLERELNWSENERRGLLNEVRRLRSRIQPKDKA